MLCRVAVWFYLVMRCGWRRGFTRCLPVARPSPCASGFFRMAESSTQRIAEVVVTVTEESTIFNS